jgi:CheY-like chemotaxis protein
MKTDPIVLVEDDDNDIFLMRRMVKKTGIPNVLNVVRDGGEAMDYLAGRGPFANRAEFPLPCLLLLDLNLPGKSGLEILHWIREQPGLETLLVIILTSSSAERDIEEAYCLGANSYLVKPASPDELEEMFAALNLYWLKHNQTPRDNVRTV